MGWVACVGDIDLDHCNHGSDRVKGSRMHHANVGHVERGWVNGRAVADTHRHASMGLYAPA